MNRKNVGMVALIGALSLALGLCAGAASLYKEARRGSAGLYSDFKAKKVGDVITILIVESNSASEVSQSGTSKSHDMDFRLTHLFGAGSKLFPGEEGDDLTRLRFSGDNDFDGQASTKNAGSVKAQLSATVKEVLPNGNLLVEGRRTIYVNKEQKNIVLSGVVRPQDVTKNNTVLSTYIADAAITFEGFGEVTDQARPGFLSRLLNLLPIF